MNMQFLSFSERPIKGTELMMLYKNAGWWVERKEKDIENMLKQDISNWCLKANFPSTPSPFNNLLNPS